MDDGPRTKVFISYSHADKGLVTPVVQLLRSLPFPVFRDQDGIAPGEVWEERLIDELEQATHVLVFWCSHSATSEWVDLEADLALEDSTKIVVPVCLDDTPLPSDLASRQAVDLRALATGSHGAVVLTAVAGARPGPVAGSSAAEGGAPPTPRRWLAVFGSLAAAVLAVGVGVAVLVASYQSELQDVQRIDTPGDETRYMVESSALDAAPGVMLAGAVLLLVVLGLGVVLVRRRRRGRRAEAKAPSTTPVPQPVAGPGPDPALAAAREISAAFERIGQGAPSADPE